MELSQEEQEKKKAKQYEEYVKKKTPVHNLAKKMAAAFISGGLICKLGQAIMNFCQWQGMDKETGGAWTSLILVFRHQRSNAPKRYIANRERHTPKYVGNRRPGNNKPLLERRLRFNIVSVYKTQNRYNAYNRRRKQQIRSALSPLALGSVYDCAHHRVINSIPDTRNGYNNTDRGNRNIDNILKIVTNQSGCNNVVDHVLTEHSRKIHIAFFRGICSQFSAFHNSPR